MLANDISLKAMKKITSSFLKLVARLNDGQYHDGTSLGKTLKFTRSAIWKAIKKLQNYGIKVDSVKGKGYALLEPLILLDQPMIKRAISHQDIDIICFESIESTNDYLRKLPKNPRIKICLAEQQTRGRARFNRNWYSPFAQNIYFSCIYPFQKDVSELAGLSLVVGLAVAKTLASYCAPNSLYVKWPNDVICQQKKLAGILIDIQAESHGNCHVIIGIGINVNMLQNDSDQISQAWISLRKISGNYIDRNKLCILLIDNLLNYLQLFAKEGLSSFMNEWGKVDYLVNKEIALQSGDKKMQGKVMGIDSLGHLLLQLKNGSLERVSSGDTTLLK